MENAIRFLQNPAPHLKSDANVPAIMGQVVLALLPATIFGISFFGIHYTLFPVLVSILSCIGFECFDCLLFKKKITISDGSALVTGLLLGLSLPPGAPFWMAIAGGGVSIILGKQMFGGLGQNIFNPALVGRAVLIISWPKIMTTWVVKGIYGFPNLEGGAMALPQGLDVITTPTPLAISKAYGFQVLHQLEPNILGRLFIGTVPGSIGETSALLLLAGFFYLLWRGIVKWDIPVLYMAGLSFVVILGGQNPLYHMLAGGALMAACFMANDYITSPLSRNGRLIFAFGAGAITGIIRLMGGYPEGVTFGILMMNAIVPLLDKLLP
ncbi:MAG: RnfABCDGE type electron transport complex subunit D, partial [Candidatus Atribacteria bacterium]|nr:RnfABCDGE type electron transport complex subunit D [Candidatus Atribacteria bacterium]